MSQKTFLNHDHAPSPTTISLHKRVLTQLVWTQNGTAWVWYICGRVALVSYYETPEKFIL